MPVEFLSDEQAAAYGRFAGPPTRAELDRFCFLDDADRREVARRRGDHNRLGFAVQLATVRFLGAFLEDPLDVPSVAVEYLAAQLGIDDPSVVKGYVERPKTAYEHAWEITQLYGYRQLADPSPAESFRAFLAARAWTRLERPTELFDKAVAWLRGERVLLPGVTVLARQVAEARADAAARLYATLAERTGLQLAERLDELLTVPDGARFSDLDRLRRAPVRASGPEMVRALDRAAEITGLGAGSVDLTDVPPGRVQALARHGLNGNAALLRRLPDPRRTATMLATTRALQVAAVDDTLDLFAVLMTTS